MVTWQKYLKSIYYNPSHPASFEGIKKVYDAVKKENKYKITYNQLQKWLQNQSAYSLNKAVKRNFKRGRVIVAGIDDQFDADLGSFADYSNDNDGYKYFLAVIDIFSRHAWVEPIKDKTSTKIIQAFDKILSNSKRLPKRLRTDAAKDFTSNAFQKYLKDKGIVYIKTHSEKQANYVERFIKTIKSRIWRYMTANNSARYIDVLPKLVKSYNRTWHSGIQSEPVKVDEKNENKLWWQMYWPKERYKGQLVKKKKEIPKEDRFKFKAGDKVRISHLASAFQREYDTKWSSEIFKIKNRFVRQKLPMYRLVDWFDDIIEGTFYQAELQKIDYDDAKDLLKIESVIKYRGRGKNKEGLIKWKGWPKKFNSWLSVNEIVSYEK